MTQESASEKLYLLDAMALAYRAHFAMISRPLITRSGLDTSAIFGFVQSLLKLLQDEPDHIAVVFDPPDGKSFRDKIYEEYKANRPPMPEPLREALPHIKKVVEAFDIPVVEMEDMEADDVIGTLAKRAESDGVDVVIVSPDKDFRQLLSDRVSILRPAYRGEEFEMTTEQTFREAYGVDPEKFVDILALLGDTSDNVPGVAGIGKKTAPGLIQEYGSLENLLNHAGEIKGKRVREGLQKHREDAELSKKLVSIVTDLDLDLDWKQLRVTAPDVAAILNLFEELEFRTLRDRILDRFGPAVKPEQSSQTAFDFDASAAAATVSEIDYRFVRSEADLTALEEELQDADRLSIQVDQSVPDAMRADLLGIALSTGDQTWFVPCPLPDGTDQPSVLAAFERIVSRAELVVVGYDLKSALMVLQQLGIEVSAQLADAMIAHYLLAPDQAHDFEQLARDVAGLRITPLKDVDLEDETTGIKVAAERAHAALAIYGELEAQLQKDERAELSREVEYPLIRVLAAMEMAGIRVDTRILDDISTQLEEQIGVLESDIFEIAGESFNIGSPKQLGEILFDKIGLTPTRKTSTGRKSTNERVLMQLSSEHPMPGMILDWRRMTKLKSTYVDSLGDYIHPETGRIHGHFNQAVAATGRLSSANPNLQNIPVRSGMGREVRRAFVPDKGNVFLAADYVQIELRILASMSEDPGLMAAFQDGEDVHTTTAARIFDVSREEVTRDMRRKAKEVNFGIPYGISSYELGQRLRISRSEAAELMEQYHRSYPNVKRLIEELIDHGRSKGYVETLRGRRRYTPAISSRRYNERAAAERIAVNMPIQGSQADMIKTAMVEIHRELAERNMESRMVLQVHDELVFEAVTGELKQLRQLVVDHMIKALPLKVPIEVEVGVGDNWLDAH